MQVYLLLGKLHGETGHHLVSTLQLNIFHVTDLLLCPLELENGKRCCFNFATNMNDWKQPSRGVLKKMCSEIMQ